MTAYGAVRYKKLARPAARPPKQQVPRLLRSSIPDGTTTGLIRHFSNRSVRCLDGHIAPACPEFGPPMQSELLKSISHRDQ